MRESRWSNLDDKELERTWEDCIDELPMEDVVADVMPWKSAMMYVLAGLVLNAIIVDFFKLNYILPAIGAVLSFLGYRRLKGENKYFLVCYIIEIVNLAQTFAALIMNTTTFGAEIQASFIMSAVRQAIGILLIGEKICLWLGLRQVQKKAGLKPGAYAVLALLGLYAVAVSVSIFTNGNVNLITMLLYIVAFGFVVRGIYKLPGELDEAGYLIRTVPIKISDKAVVIALAAILTVGSVCGYIFGNGYRMEWSTLDETGTEKIENTVIDEVKEQLIEQGFPKYVLDDLTDEEIEACGGAQLVLTHERDCNNGLRFTDVAVQVQDEEELWIIFHYFRWHGDKEFYGTQSVQIWTAEHELADGWLTVGELNGRVLCGKNGVTYASPYHSIIQQDIFCTFSFPKKGTDCRGYVVYSTIHTDEDCMLFYDFINYTYQERWMQYPVTTAYEYRKTEEFGGSTFFTIQNPFVLHFEDDGIEVH